MKKLTSIMCLVVVVVIVISTFVLASAAESSFSSKLIDSNSYTFVTAPLKDTVSTYGTIRINQIYKADGSASNYTRIYAKPEYGGTAYIVYKGTSKDLPLPQNFQVVGINIPLYAKGYDSSLDCRITGYWNAH